MAAQSALDKAAFAEASKIHTSTECQHKALLRNPLSMRPNPHDTHSTARPAIAEVVRQPPPYLLRAAAARVIVWGKQLHARVQSPEFGSGITGRPPLGKHSFGFVCSYSDAEFQSCALNSTTRVGEWKAAGCHLHQGG